MEKSIQLASINSFGKLILHSEGIDFIRSLSPPISILSIGGPKQTGKSYLINSIISKQNAFQIGKNSKSTTRGVRLWSKPFLAYNDEGKIASVLIMDCEGFVNSQTNQDKRIMALVLLISNSFLYNSFGPIQKNSLFDLQYIIEIARIMEKLQYKVSSCDFNWILRDFHLNSLNQFGTHINPKLYMENCLFEAEDKASKSTVETLKNYFSIRNCFCLVKPNFDGQQNPQFTEQIIELRKVITGIRSFENDGEALIILLMTYVQAMNCGDSFQKVFQEGYDCRIRIDCIDRFHDELRSLEQKKSLNIIQDFDEKLSDLQFEFRQYYKQRMCSQKQLKALDDDMEQLIHDFQQSNDLKPSKSVNHIDNYRQSQMVQLKVPHKPSKMVRVSLNVSQTQKIQENFIPSISINRIHSINTCKTLQSKIQQYETKVYRYELEVDCSRKEIRDLRQQYNIVRTELEQKNLSMELLINAYEQKERKLESIIEDLEDTVAELKKEKILALSEIEKIKILTTDKVKFLEDQLREVNSTILKQKVEKEERFRAQLNQYIKQIASMKISHEEQIVQIKSIYKNSNDRISQSSTLKFNQNFYKDMKEQIEIGQKLKQQNEKCKFIKLQLENKIKILKQKIAANQEFHKENVEQIIKRSKESQKFIESIWQGKLKNKDSLINQLEDRIAKVSNSKKMQEQNYQNEIEQKNKKITLLEQQINKFSSIIESNTIQNDKLKNQIQHLSDKLVIFQESAQKYESENQKLQIKLREYQLQNAKLHDYSERNKNQLIQAIQQNESLINQFRKTIENEQRQRQNTKTAAEKNLIELRNLFNTERQNFHNKIIQQQSQIQKLKEIEKEAQELKYQFYQRQINFEECIEEQNKQRAEMERTIEQYENKISIIKKELGQAQSKLIKNKQANDQEIEQVQRVFQIKNEEDIQNFKHLALQIEQKQKNIYILTETLEKERRKSKFEIDKRQDQIKRGMEKLLASENNHERQICKYKIEIDKLKRQNLQNYNEKALLKQRVEFLIESNQHAMDLKNIEIKKHLERFNKLQQKYNQTKKQQDMESQRLNRKIEIMLKERNICSLNINDLRVSLQTSLIKANLQNQLHRSQITKLHQINTTIKAQKSTLEKESIYLTKSKELLKQNYELKIRLSQNSLHLNKKQQHF